MYTMRYEYREEFVDLILWTGIYFCSFHLNIFLMTYYFLKTGVDGNDVSNVNHFNFNQFMNQKLKSYSSNDRLYFIKSLSMIIQHSHIQSSIHQLCIQLLQQISSCFLCYFIGKSKQLTQHHFFFLNFIFVNIYSQFQQELLHQIMRRYPIH